MAERGARAGRPEEVEFLLLGGGLASASAADILRQEGAAGRIVIVGGEPRLPYHRPPLSGRLLKGEAMAEPPPVLTEDDCRARRIEVLCGVRALSVDTGRRLVATDAAGTLAYGQLLIATGATPMRPPVPGALLGGVFTLRTADDAAAIHAAAGAGKRCVVVGAGFIGMEVCAALQARGVQVALVTGGSPLFSPLHDESISEFFCGLYAARGIAVVPAVVAAFEGEGRVAGVLLDDGRRIECDFVVVGVGVRPDTDFLQGSGIELDDGVRVDRHLRTNVDGVWAAGDVANFFDPVFNRRHRIEHWDNAVKQGRLAARNMLGQRLPYDEVTGYFCHVFDVDFQFVGQPEGARQRRTLGRPEDRSWARLYLEDAVPRALFTMGRPARETAAVQALIRHRTNISAFEPELGRPGFVLDTIPSQTVLVLQGGGAMGAFECGVVRALEEHGTHPDIVAGVSIGAFNGAIVASHPRHAAEALEAFWNDLAIAAPAFGDERARQLWGSLMVLCFGVPGFFRPRWWGAWPPDWLGAWTSFYDPAPIRRLLGQYVDFAALNSSPVRLLVSAVDVETAQLQVFDNYVDDFTVDHLLASGSLPPGLPWTTVGGRHYWDGGIVSNSPLDQVTERCGAAGKRVIVVDLFPHQRPLPGNLMEVLTRRDEIVYAERIRRAGADESLLRDARRLIDFILSQVDEPTAARIRQLPPYVQVMGAPDGPAITRVMREAAEGEPAGRDFDFSLGSVHALMREGLEAGRRVLAR